MPELPSGTVTFLFTDLEGSTRLWQEHPDAMQGALARHDEIVRDAIVTRTGVIVKTTGDGAHAVFGDASDAIAAAVAAQVALAAEAWSLPEPLRVRMGIHSGPAELREGDYYGTTVNRAARIMSVAHGRQIVVSSATSELVRDDVSVELIDLGEHRLRDLGRPEHLFQVVADGLEREFAPLRSLDALPGNLPSQQTSFVGRDEDVVGLVKAFGEARLVTLVGTGGVGKTRLAVQVAAEMVPRFEDGAWFCDLASARDGDAMAQVVATTLGCVQRPGLSLAASVVEYVKVRELLLVLDNCEQLLDEVSEFAEALLDACPRVKALATSREAFGIPGERVSRVRSLETPEPSAAGEALLAWSAARLFADRVADAGVGGDWNDAQWAAVGEICRRVDGIPLAIELAAARVASMRPTEIAAHLDERFRLLTGTRRGRVERQQTLRSTVEWSYELLAPDERAVFDRLGVFAGTFDGPAAVAVAGDDALDEWRIMDTIASLVSKSMVVVEDGPDDTTRYTMLETLRQFARERLEDSGEADGWRHRHAGYYAQFAETAGVELRGPDEFVWVARVAAERENLRAAVLWGMDRDAFDERELAVRIVVPFCFSTNSLSGIAALAAQTVPAAQTCSPSLRCPVLAMAAHYEMHQGRSDRARALAEDAMRDGLVADAPNPLMPFQVLGLLEMAGGNAQGCLEAYEAGRARFDDVEDQWVRTLHLSGAASMEGMTGQLDEARVDAATALEQARQLRNPTLLANALNATAWALQRAEPAEALAAAEEFVELYRQGLNTGGATPGFLALVGGLRFRFGDPKGGFELLREAVLVARDTDARPPLAAALDWSLSPLVRIGRPESAAIFVGALSDGPLAGIGDFPLSASARNRTLERVSDVVGDETAESLLALGAAMSYDELVAYAIEHLEPPHPDVDDAHSR